MCGRILNGIIYQDSIILGYKLIILGLTCRCYRYTNLHGILWPTKHWTLHLRLRFTTSHFLLTDDFVKLKCFFLSIGQNIFFKVSYSWQFILERYFLKIPVANICFCLLEYLWFCGRIWHRFTLQINYVERYKFPS